MLRAWARSEAPGPYPQLGAGFRFATSATGVLVNVHDQPGQVPVSDLPRGRLTLSRLVIRRRSDVQHPAGHDGETPGGWFTDQEGHFFGGMFSLAK